MLLEGHCRTRRRRRRCGTVSDAHGKGEAADEDPASEEYSECCRLRLLMNMPSSVRRRRKTTAPASGSIVRRRHMPEVTKVQGLAGTPKDQHLGLAPLTSLPGTPPAVPPIRPV